MKEAPEEVVQLLAQLEERNKYTKLFTYFPETGPLRRELYPAHTKFFEVGATYHTVLFEAANQIGKTTASLYELTLHLLGIYPSWWTGHRFDKPIRAWACGYSAETVKRVIQDKLLGDIGDFGTGMIPRKFLDFESLTEAKKAGTSITNIKVQHKSGGFSTVELKTYESGRRAFEGQAIDFIVLDEEPPVEIYSECSTRTITTKGKLRLTFTPLLGETPLILKLINGKDWATGEKSEYVFLVNCSWWDVPHLTEEDIKRELANTPDYLRDARSRGIPRLNAGQVYPFDEKLVFIDPIEIGPQWKRAFAMDFGWEKPTAMLWGAWNPDDGVLYCYSEHYAAKQPPFFHAKAIEDRNKAVGFKIPGLCDPSGGGKGPKDGKTARSIYNDEYGITLEDADNAIEGGIMKVIDLITTGKLKIFKTCTNTLAEYRMLKRNDKGVIVGEDHLMDCMRYLVASGKDLANNTSSGYNKTDWELARQAAEQEDFAFDRYSLNDAFFK